ncbi:MAG: rod shape-determining protein MreC [Deltaproteobacteria bacterium]|nr:rod shape-determining protein MreC [Deltaproteobacteria bacterium]
MPLFSVRLRNYRKPILLILLIIFILLGRWIQPLATFQDRSIHLILNPIISSTRFVFGQVQNLFLNYIALVRTEKTNRALLQDLEKLQLENLKLQTEKKKWEAFQEFESFKKTSSTSLVAAQVLAYDPSLSSRTLWINKGFSEGVKKGQVVIRPEGLVGIITQVQSHDAQVLLITDPQMAVDAELKTSQARGVLKGFRNRLELNRDYWISRLEYLGLSEEVREQDLVVSSGLDQVFPAGIPIGKVLRVIKDEKGLFLSAEILPEVDFSKLQNVYVMNPSL